MTCKAPLINDLKARRQALGLSLKEVAERCGIEERFLGDWEHGLGSPRLDAAERWAGALGLRLGVAQGQPAARTGVRVDWDKHCITVDGTPVRLTPMEWKALALLAATPGQLVSHQELFRHLYGADQPYRAQSTAIRVLITKLRRLLPLRIAAQWGRGYVISGIEPSAPREAGLGARQPAAEDTDEPKIEPPRKPEPPLREALALVPHSLRLAPLSVRRDVVAVKLPPMRRAPAPSSVPSSCRAEELGVIERFMAERGVTRCPDVATIQHSPLPTLIWDKVKRKWVRPAMSAQQQAG